MATRVPRHPVPVACGATNPNPDVMPFHDL